MGLEELGEVSQSKKEKINRARGNKKNEKRPREK